MSELVKVERDGAVLVISLNRPEKKNSLTDAMYATFADALDGAGQDKAVRSILIRGEGETFCAGNDISDFAAAAMGLRDRETMAVGRVLKSFAHAEKPIVAAVKGRAVGIGTTMLLHCDLVYVAEDALLTTPFVDLALTPEAASSLLLPTRIGHARAFAMFALGEAMDGKTAALTGLANAALPAAEVEAKARAAAQALALRPLGAVMQTKRLMRNADAIWALMQTESAIFFERMLTPEAREAFTAFAERRPADFTKLG